MENKRSNDDRSVVIPLSLLEKFANIFTKEPFKSFRKANVTNGDDLLTPDGARIFINWLLKSKFAEDFNKEIVQEILKEDKKK